MLDFQRPIALNLSVQQGEINGYLRIIFSYMTFFFFFKFSSSEVNHLVSLSLWKILIKLWLQIILLFFHIFSHPQRRGSGLINEVQGQFGLPAAPSGVDLSSVIMH